MNFVLIKRQLSNMTEPSYQWWRLKDSGKLENECGGWNPLCDSDEIIETLELKGWNELWTPENIAKTTEYQNLLKNSTDKNLKIGWLSPEGKMHYCRYTEHIDYVHIILNSDVPTIEQQGWLHIYADVSTVHPASGRRMTQEQARTIREELGLHVFDEDILY